MKTSTLNPLASSFVPSKPRLPSEMVSLGKISFKSIANKYLQELIEEKKKSNDNSITREEISAIVLKLITYGNKKFQTFDPVILRAYLRSKVPEAVSIKPLVAKKIDEPKPPKTEEKKVTFDLSAFKVPKGKILLVSLWGLHRQEQALRPMISLSHRPEPLEDPVWSVTEKDLKLWNAHAVEKPCACPPMFGYTVPPGFFGNPLKVDFECDQESVHLNRYPERPDGNELVLVPSERNTFVCPDVFEDPEDGGLFKEDLDFYVKEFKTIVDNVCSMIAEEKGNETKFCPNEIDTATCCMEAFWDSDVTANKPKADQVAEDDNCHPLLDGFRNLEETSNEGVATNIKELIRRSLSNETTDSGIYEDCCDPPCSDWCHSSPKCTTRTSEALGLLKDTTDFILGTSDFTPALSHRPGFKRSFSANDCEAYLKKLPPSQETLGFLRKDPLGFKKLKDPIEGWKDSDSGIGSNCSSPEDSRDYGFEEGDENVADVDMAPMWSLFSGEGSLWQPLPCPNQEECVKFPHKRVRELRRLQSMT